MHAVPVTKVLGPYTACGRAPANGFVLDLFNTHYCILCLRRLSLACPECNGRRLKEGSWCIACKGTGVRKTEAKG